MKYKKIIIIILAILLINIAIANQNLDVDSGLYLAWDTGDRSITNTSPSNTDELSAHGWTLSSGSFQYSNDCGATETTRNGSLCFKDISGSDTYADATNINVTNVSCEIFHRWDSAAGTQGGFWEMFEGANRIFLLGTHSGSSGNYAYCIDGGGCYQNSGIAWNNGTSAWTHYEVYIGVNNISLYANNVLIASDTSTTYDTPSFIRIWGDYSANTNKWDELRCWQGTLADKPAHAPIIPTPDLSVLLEASNGTYLQDSDMTEETNFFPVGNYTLSGSPITSGVCNVTMQNVSAHFGIVSSSNFTLSNSDAQLSLIIEESTTNAIRDDINFRVCRENLKIPLQIYVNGSLHRTIDQNIIPLCSVGFHNENNLSTEYITQRSLNITLKCDTCDGGLRQHTILVDNGETLHFERDVTTKTNNLDYNTSTLVYEYHKHLYHATRSGIFNISVTCNETQQDRILSIGDLLPTIEIELINNVTYTDGVIVEANTQYDVLIDIFGDIITSIDFNVTYANGTLINQTNTELNSINQSILDLDGLYNISIFVVDDEGNTTSKVGFFNISDTTKPTITWGYPVLANTSTATTNQSTNLSVVVSDINLFAYQLAIYRPNGSLFQNLTLSNINVTSLTIRDGWTPDIAGVWDFKIDVYDAHTDRIINDIPKVIDQDNIIFSNNEQPLTITYTGIHTFRKQPVVIKEFDRYTIKYNFDMVDYRFTAKVTHKWRVTCANAIYRPNSNYKSHIVCLNSLMWFDLEDNGVLDDVIVSSCGAGCFDITAQADNDEIIQTRSVGIINVQHEEVQASVSDASIPSLYNINLISSFNWFNTQNLNTNTTAGVLLFFFLFLLVVALLIFAEYMRIPAFMFLAVIVLFLFSFLIYSVISVIIGIAFTLSAIVYFVRSLIFLIK